MSLRFTQTDKWKDEWFLSLTNDNRIIWQYVLDNCSIAGVFKEGLTHMNYFCKTNITESEFIEIFKDRVCKVGNIYFIPKFLKVQYPSGLNSKKPLIVGVRQELQRHNLVAMVNELLPNHKIIIDQSLTNDYGTGNGNGNGNGIKGGVGENGIPKPGTPIEKITEAQFLAIKKIPVPNRTSEQTEILRDLSRTKYFHLC